MKILFIQTGGTIDKAYPMNDDNHGYNFQIGQPAFERILKRVNPSCEYETRSILKKDSTDITDDDRLLIHELCANDKADKIIITHGTDTMIQTARVLSSIHGKTIVITGAMQPELFKDSDADFNLGTAIGAMSYVKPDIYIAMGGKIMKWDEVMFDASINKFRLNT